ncbi:hypothetical protein [Bacillus marinisedimentorum]|uniref:hypothetical protein n=1 Tax=Bacillus marinisedimentorum TaxID=1821260 RepID=UPI0007E051F6|nr:hypothetical protein [Bacillus marinisedimentorum]
MENKNNRRRDIPDFDELNDRMIMEASESPSLVIKTNLDPADPNEKNPYIDRGETQEKENRKFNRFFGNSGNNS